MKKFRQKSFSKGKKLIKSGITYIKDHPILPISTASLGVGIANYKTNTKRQKEGKEQHKEQLNALKSLNENIIKNSEALNTVNLALQNNNKNLELSREKENNKPRRTLLFFRRKNYSIESGGFNGRKVEPNPTSVSKGALVGGALGGVVGTILDAPNGQMKGGVLIGAGIGAGLGALVTWLNNVAEKSIFNRGLSKGSNSYKLLKYLEEYYTEPTEVEEETTTQNMGGGVKYTNTVRRQRSSNIDPKGTLFGVDSDPKKYVVNILLRGNVLVMLINNPTSFEMKKLNMILDNYCKSYKLADYTSEKLGKDMYLVEVNIVQSTEGSLVVNMIESGLKVNILTTDRFGIKNK